MSKNPTHEELCRLLAEIQQCAAGLPGGGIGPDGPTEEEINEANEDGDCIGDESCSDLGQRIWLIAEQAKEMVLRNGAASGEAPKTLTEFSGKPGKAFGRYLAQKDTCLRIHESATMSKTPDRNTRTDREIRDQHGGLRRRIFPSERPETLVEIYNQSGDPVFAVGLYGPINGDMVEKIEKDLNNNRDFMQHGDGRYLYQAVYEAEQTGDYGIIELPGYWGLNLVAFTSTVSNATQP